MRGPAMHPRVAFLTRTLRGGLIFLPFLITIYFLVYLAQTFTPETEVNEIISVPIPRRREFTLTFRMRIERSLVCHSNETLNQTVQEVCEEISREEKKYYKPRDSTVNPFRHKFLTDASHLCDSSTVVVILVHSLHTYRERRDAIRQTWGGAAVKGIWPHSATTLLKVSLAFVLGLNHNATLDQHLRRESLKHRDIVQGDFYEDYHNMTLKSLLGLKWVTQYCPNVRYLIKSDDDMIINLPYLFRVLSETNMTRGILGPYNENSRVMRRGKWSIPIEVFPFYYYPAYESGAAYVISGDLVPVLYNTSHYVPSIFIDDVYITGILAKVVEARHVQIYGFSYWNSKRLHVCDIIEDVMFTGTKMTPRALLDMWKLIKDGKTCALKP